MDFRERTGYVTEDGHRYSSIPTEVPKVWAQWYSEEYTLMYGSGPYLIVRRGHGTRFSYDVNRDVDGRAVSIGWPYSRLKDAKAQAVRNANGLDVFNWA